MDPYSSCSNEAFASCQQQQQQLNYIYQCPAPSYILAEEDIPSLVNQTPAFVPEMLGSAFHSEDQGLSPKMFTPALKLDIMSVLEECELNQQLQAHECEAYQQQAPFSYDFSYTASSSNIPVLDFFQQEQQKTSLWSRVSPTNFQQQQQQQRHRLPPDSPSRVQKASQQQKILKRAIVFPLDDEDNNNSFLGDNNVSTKHGSISSCNNKSSSTSSAVVQHRWSFQFKLDSPKGGEEVFIPVISLPKGGSKPLQFHLASFPNQSPSVFLMTKPARHKRKPASNSSQ